MKRKLTVFLMLALMTVGHLTASAAAGNTLSENDLLKLLAGGVYNARIASLVHYRGINFVPTAHDLELLRQAGADEALLHEVATAPRVLPEVTQHPPEPSAHVHLAPQSVGYVKPSTGTNALDVGRVHSNLANPVMTLAP